MRHLFFALLLALSTTMAANAPRGGADAAMRDAQHLVDCMRVFDSPCTTGLTYTKFLEDQGMPRSVMIESVTNLHTKLKSIGAKYTRFQIVAPKEIYQGDGRYYAFIPYEQVLQAGIQQGRLRAYFIGVSLDAGTSWQFVDGINVTPERIKMVMPSYAGQALPPVGPLE